MKPAEFRAILRHSNVQVRQAFVMLHRTGMRFGEVAGLRWESIDFNAGLIILRTHKTVKKTRRPRVIPLTDVVNKLLRYLLRTRPAELTERHNHIFLNTQNRPWQRSALHWHLVALRDRGIVARDQRRQRLIPHRDHHPVA